MNSKFDDAVTMKSTESLAAATVEINGLFLLSKNILRTHVVSIYAGGYEKDIDMDPVKLFSSETRGSDHNTRWLTVPGL